MCRFPLHDSMAMCIGPDDHRRQMSNIDFAMHNAQMVFTIASKSFRLILPAIASLFGSGPLFVAMCIHFLIAYVNEGYIFKKTQTTVSTHSLERCEQV